MKTKILITGASGLIGKEIIEKLRSKNITYCTLTTQKRKIEEHSFYWNPERMEMDVSCLSEVTHIIHLAGAGVMDHPWTISYQKKIIDSRINGIKLLYNELKKQNLRLQCFVSASAIGIYGDRGSDLLYENENTGTDFLADVCRKWEFETLKMNEISCRVCVGRIGLVLSENGGALPQLIKTMPMGVAGYFSKKGLWNSWIHINDATNAFLFLALNNSSEGIYNLTAPTAILHKELIERLKNKYYPKSILLPIPSFALELGLGARATLLLSSQRCSSEKLTKSGFRFEFSEI